MKGRHREDSQAGEDDLGGPAGGGQEALGIGLLTALQAGQVAAHAEQVHAKLLQVLLPLLNLHSKGSVKLASDVA